MANVKVVLVDDHPMVREGLRALIVPESDLEVCNEASNCAEALDVIGQADPDIALVDVQMKDGNGIDLVRELHRRHPALKMLVVSMHDEDLFAERALKAGASGYISKDESSRGLVTAIRRVLEGKHYVSEAITEKILARASGVDVDDGSTGIASLTDRELEVFDLISEGMTAREIAARLGIAVKTVNTFRENIKAKLDLDSAARLTRVAIEWKLTGGGLN